MATRVVTARRGRGEPVVATERLPGSPHDAQEAARVLEGLGPIERTLLIPLMARVWAHRWYLDITQPDTSAERVLAQLHEQVPTWMPDPVTLCCIAWRTRQLVGQARSHFERYPGTWGVNLGAGLSNYFQWLDNGTNHWVDTDLEGVMQLRSQCLPHQSRAQGLSLDICENHWWSRLAACIKSRHQPLFIMLEGVLLYLQPAQAHQVLMTLGERAPAGSCVMFDVIPAWLMGWPVRMPAAEEVQPMFLWGVDSLASLDSLHPRLHLKTVSCSPWSVDGWPGWSGNDWQPLSPYALAQMTVS